MSPRLSKIQPKAQTTKDKLRFCVRVRLPKAISEVFYLPTAKIIDFCGGQIKFKALKLLVKDTIFMSSPKENKGLSRRSLCFPKEKVNWLPTTVGLHLMPEAPQQFPEGESKQERCITTKFDIITIFKEKKNGKGRIRTYVDIINRN